MDGLVKLSTFIYGAKIIVTRDGAHCENTTAAEKVGI
jgi:hypothetical protein